MKRETRIAFPEKVESEEKIDYLIRKENAVSLNL